MAAVLAEAVARVVRPVLMEQAAAAEDRALLVWTALTAEMGLSLSAGRLRAKHENLRSTH
jgi:hypothetical protein